MLGLPRSPQLTYDRGIQFRSLAPAFPLLLAACASTPPEVRARELARRFLILDGHIDVPYRLHGQQASGTVDDVGEATQGGDFDYPRAVAGGLDAPFFSIYTPSELEAQGTSKSAADELIDLCEALIARHPNRFELARTAADVRRIAAQPGRIALLYGMENGSPLAGDLANLEHFYRRGVRYITLTHGQDNHICDSSYDTLHTHKGLSPFGRDVVRRMNELGIVIDVSHVSDDVFWQVMELSKAPVIASHSSLRHFVPGFERNMSDEMVQALGKHGGVIQINFGSGFLTAPANAHSTTRRKAVEEFAAAHGGAESNESKAFAEQYDREHPFPFASVTDVADHI